MCIPMWVVNTGVVGGIIIIILLGLLIHQLNKLARSYEDGE